MAMDLLVIGAGPAGVVAALRAAQLGARTTLLARDSFGGMAANDGPVPVRTLAHAARLIREAHQLEQYGIEVGEPALDYSRLLGRVAEVVQQVRTHSALRRNLEEAGVAIHEHVGVGRFVDDHRVACERGLTFEADRIILCTGGRNRELTVPGSELTVNHSHAWALTDVPPSMLVVGAGATGVQVASIFNALGARVDLFEAGTRILKTEDEDVSDVMATVMRSSGINVHEQFGTIERFEQSPLGTRMIYAKDGAQRSAEATAVVVAIGWQADTDGLHLAQAGIQTDRRGYIQVDEYLRTTAPHVFAAGDVNGRLMLVPQAAHEGYIAANNAVLVPMLGVPDLAGPIGSFTDPEYAQMGLTEANARAIYPDVAVSKVVYEALPRPLIDGRPVGFCKLIVERGSHRILGCHIVGERAVEIAQVAAVAMAANTTVDVLAQIPFSFPTYTNVLGRAALDVAHQLNASGIWDAAELDLVGAA
jgi:dihydrolipoamide dehydrogenase